MRVRVFVPKPLDIADGSDHAGTDHEFPQLPEVGHLIRFTDVRSEDYRVRKGGFIQDSGSFLPCIWVEVPSAG